MTERLGCPQSPEKIAARQARYERLAASRKGRVFKIIEPTTGRAVGSVGYSERDWRAGPVYEIGWSVVPECQGRGLEPVPSLAAGHADGLGGRDGQRSRGRDQEKWVSRRNSGDERETTG